MINTLKCPYCGTSQTVRVETNLNRAYSIMHCDCEVGGCNKPFVVTKSSITLSHATASPLASYSDLFYDARPEKIAHNTLQFGALLARIAMLAAQRGDQFDYRFNAILNYFTGDYRIGGWKSHTGPDYEFGYLYMERPDETLSEVIQKLNELVERPEETPAEPVAEEVKEATNV
jgi:hypothetical protein